MQFENPVIAIIGLGYVGLPLAIEFGKKYKTIGYDIKKNRISELAKGIDSTSEASPIEIKNSINLHFSHNENDIKEANIFIVTVPTPIDQHRQPDLTPLIRASELIARNIKKGDTVIYESTVYPGATEEDCIPIIEINSGLKYNHDFYAGYSPERINPGDKSRPLTKIKKVTSGSTPEIASKIDNLYNSIIEAGTFKATSIKVAEASKIIENTQRDVNIALINELSLIFENLNINTSDVIEAAATKWNFIKLMPGLVGGHCIGVDPYYLMHKSMSTGHIPDIIRSAREINDGMAKSFAGRVIKKMIKNGQPIKNSKALIMGVTFKENCPDIRNTKVIDLIEELSGFGINCEIHDPLVNTDDLFMEYGHQLITEIPQGRYDAIIISVAHDQYISEKNKIISYGKKLCTIFDLKNILGSHDYGQLRV